MSLRTFQNQMKEPIYKDDCLRVVLYGLLYAILVAIVAGALQFFTQTYLHISFGIFVFALAYFIGKRISQSFSSYHLLYAILSVVFFILSYFFYRVTIVCFQTHDLVYAFRVIFTGPGFLNLIVPFLNPYNYTGLGILNNILEIFIVGFSGVLSFRIPKSRDF